MKIGHKLIAALIPIIASLITIDNYLNKIDKLQIKQARIETQIYYIEKKLDEMDKDWRWSNRSSL